MKEPGAIYGNLEESELVEMKNSWEFETIEKNLKESERLWENIRECEELERIWGNLRESEGICGNPWESGKIWKNLEDSKRI